MHLGGGAVVLGEETSGFTWSGLTTGTGQTHLLR